MNNEYKNLKKSLDDFLAKKREKELGNDRQSLIKDVALEVAVVFRPILEAMAAQGRLSREEIKAVAEDLAARINIPEINVPEIVMPRLPDINVPEPKVTVNFDASRIRIPDVVMPDEMNVKGWVSLMGVDLDHPLPVQLRDEKGKILNLFEGLTQVIGGGGGFARQVKINNPASEPIPVTGSLTVSASATTAAVPTNNDGVTYNSDNPLPVTITSGGTATSAANIVDSSGVAYTGSNPLPVTGSVAVSGVTGSIGATILNGEGLARDSWLISAITASVAAMNVDSSGVGYSGSNPLPVTLVTSTVSSTVAVGAVVADAADDGSAPLKGGGIARQTNPSAVADGDTVSSSHDDLGRQLTRIQARDLIATAYVAKATGSTFGTETTLLASGSGVLLDLIYVMATNDSTAATYVELRASTGGTVTCRLDIPANSSIGFNLPVPYNAPFADHTWTVDFPDITGTNCTVSALFTKEV